MLGKESFNIKEIKAIIVDDHDPIRKAMKRILNTMGISEVIECFDGSEALKELSKQPDIDLVLCDLYMRKVSGFDVLTYIRNRAIKSDIPIIIVTGEASKEDIVKASDMGADDYIIKPFQAEAMILKTQKILSTFYSPPPLIQKLRDGDRYLIAKHYNKALECYEDALAIDKNSKRAKHSKGVALFRCNQIEDAIKILTENTVDSPSYYKNYATLADIYIKQKNYTKSIELMRKELHYNPKQPNRQNLIAKLLIKKDDIDGAIDHFRETLRDNVRNQDALLGIGQAFALSHDINKAIYYFKRLRRYYPTDSTSLKAVIKYCSDANELKKAENVLREENKKHPDRHDSYVFLAKFYVIVNRLEEAYNTINSLFKIDDSNIDGLKVKAAIEMKQKSYEAALQTLKKIIQKGTDLESYLAQSECLQRLNRYPESIESLHRVLFITPKHPTALYLLAQAYKKTKQVTKAYLLFLAAKQTGASQEKCSKNSSLCWSYVQKRRKNAFKISA